MLRFLLAGRESPADVTLGDGWVMERLRHTAYDTAMKAQGRDVTFSEAPAAIGRERQRNCQYLLICERHADRHQTKPVETYGRSCFDQAFVPVGVSFADK